MQISENLLTRFEAENRGYAVGQIVDQEKWVSYCKSMYVKHAFDDMGNTFKELYKDAIDILKFYKKEYKDKYGS